jgi:hypothetical protein
MAPNLVSRLRRFLVGGFSHFLSGKLGSEECRDQGAQKGLELTNPASGDEHA